MTAHPLRILFGGSFDPVHEGHLETAMAIHRALGEATVSLLPAACSPLKSAGSADTHRLAMLQHAIRACPGLVIDDRELQRPAPSYTVDTLRAVRNEIGRKAPLVWVMGEDALVGLPYWKGWKSLNRLAHLLVVNRPDAMRPVDYVAADWLGVKPFTEGANSLQSSPNGKLLRITLPPQPFSSTAIRHALRQRHTGSTKPDGLPDVVWQYILEHDLYLPGTSPDTGHEAL